MRLAATIEVEGVVTALGRDADPPRDGVSFRADGEEPKTLYVNGMEVGELVKWPDIEADRVSAYGDLSIAAIHRTRLDCWIELPYRGDKP